MTDQQFCLRWNNHQSTLVAVFDGLLEKGVLVDCTLAAEGQQLTAHKVVLAACSPFLETLLSRHYDKHPILILKDVKFSELKAMMDYMYRGEVNISQDQLGTFLKAAESLQIKGLSDSGGGNEKSVDSHTNKRHHDRKQHRPNSPLKNSLLGEAKRAPYNLQNSVRNSLKSSPLLVDIPEDSPVNRPHDGSMSPVLRKKKRPRDPDENSSNISKAENIPHEAVNNHQENSSNSLDLPNSIPVPRVPSPSESKPTPSEPNADKTELKQEMEEEEDINEDSVELTLEDEDMGEAGPSHNDGEFGEFYGGTQDGDHRDGQGSAKSRWSSNLQFLLTDNMLYQNHPESLNLISESASVPPKLAKLKPETKSKQRKSSSKDSSTSSSVMNRYLVVQQDKFSCQNCERVYKNKDSLGRHLKWECGKEPSFPCSRCPYKARYKADLLRHEKTRHLKREANPFADASDEEHPGKPLHHSLYAQVKQDMYAEEDKSEGLRGNSHLQALKRRGRPRKYMTSGKPIGRPRKYRPAIEDPIKFLQAASISGLFKVNDENAQISGISSFLNPNFRNGEKTVEGKNEQTGEQQPVPPVPALPPASDGVDKLDSNDLKNCFACNFCGKSYKKKKHYNRHVNFECINTEPRFLCTMCSYKARRKEHLIRHLRSHIGDMMNSSDYGLVSMFKDDAATGQSLVANAEGSGLPVNNHNGKMYNPPFGFVAM